LQQLEIVRQCEPSVFPSEETAKGFEILWSNAFEGDDHWNAFR